MRVSRLSDKRNTGGTNGNTCTGYIAWLKQESHGSLRQTAVAALRASLDLHPEGSHQTVHVGY